MSAFCGLEVLRGRLRNHRSNGPHNGPAAGSRVRKPDTRTPPRTRACQQDQANRTQDSEKARRSSAVRTRTSRARSGNRAGTKTPQHAYTSTSTYVATHAATDAGWLGSTAGSTEGHARMHQRIRRPVSTQPAQSTQGRVAKECGSLRRQARLLVHDPYDKCGCAHRDTLG